VGMLEVRVSELTELVHQVHNGRCGEGGGTHYNVIPFRLTDGHEVLPEARLLPPLTTAATVRELTLGQSMPLGWTKRRKGGSCFTSLAALPLQSSVLPKSLHRLRLDPIP